MPLWRILIVDDEPDIRTIIRGALSSKYEIVEAQDGLDALQKLELSEPDFVILDVMMPIMDGFQTCEAIRKHPRFKGLSVLFLSALNTNEDIKKGYVAGANLYLTKPFDPARLLRNVDVFFETNSPVYVKKRYSLQELQELNSKPPEDIAQAHVSVAHASRTPAPADAPSVAPAKSRQASPQSAATTPRPLPSTPRTTERARILIVDDDLDLMTVCRSALESEYEVVQAGNGIEAIEKITTYQPDMIMLDAMMPKMSGYQLCQSLRRNPRYVNTPILFASGKASPRDREYAMRIGASDFLSKPFECSELKTKVQGLTRLPTFKIYPKTLSADQLMNAESERRKQLEEHKDRVHRKQETELEKFLRENS